MTLWWRAGLSSYEEECGSFSPITVIPAEAPRQVGAIPYSEVRLYIDVQPSNQQGREKKEVRNKV